MVPKSYGQKIHLVPLEDTLQPLSPSATKNIQRKVDSSLYYARAVDNTIHTALNDIATKQSSPTIKTKDVTLMLIDYLYTHPNAKIRYHARNMQLYIDSDAAYLVTPKEANGIAGYFYLSDHYTGGTGNSSPKLNAPIHIGCQLLKHVVLSVVEAETSAIFNNCKIDFWIRRMLETLGRKQQIIPLKTDNSTVEAFSNNTLKEKRSKYYSGNTGLVSGSAS